MRAYAVCRFSFYYLRNRRNSPRRQIRLYLLFCLERDREFFCFASSQPRAKFDIEIPETGEEDSEKFFFFFFGRFNPIAICRNIFAVTPNYYEKKTFWHRKRPKKISSSLEKNWFFANRRNRRIYLSAFFFNSIRGSKKITFFRTPFDTYEVNRNYSLYESQGIFATQIRIGALRLCVFVSLSPYKVLREINDASQS